MYKRQQQARDRGRGQCLGVHLRNYAFVGNLHLLDAGLGKLAGERAELFCERYERLQLGRLLGADRGKVDGVGNGAAQEVIRHLLGDLQRDILLRFHRGGAEMRRANDIGQREERALRGRFFAKHIERRAGDLARFERLGQGRLVDELAAGAIDQPDALFRCV